MLRIEKTFRRIVIGLCFGCLALIVAVGSQPVDAARAQCPTITIGPNLLRNGTAGASYNETITATGGVAPYTYTVTGELPPGLNLLAAGVLSGRPLITGTFSFTIKAKDASNCEGSRAYLLLVDCPAPFEVSPLQLPAVVLGQPYNQTLPPNTTFTPAKFTAIEQLPAGLKLSESGVLSGTPTVTGQFSFRVKQNDFNGCESFRRYLLTIYPPPCARIFSVSPKALPNPTEGRFYSQTLTVTGDVIAPYRFSISEGTLPEGLALSSTGVLSGMPTHSASSVNFTVRVDDAGGCYALQAYSLVVYEACSGIRISPMQLPTATQGAAYANQFSATVGVAPYSYSGIGLPQWLTLSASGLLSGTPTLSGAVSFQVRVEDSNQCATTQNYTLQVNPLPTSRTLRGQVGGRFITVELDSPGDVNALSLSLLFNPAEWRYEMVFPTVDGIASVPTFNTSQLSLGRWGITMTLPAGRTFAAGTRQLFSLAFTPLSANPPPIIAVDFGDAPVKREFIAVDGGKVEANSEIRFASGAISTLASVSAASFAKGELARSQIAAAFGANLAAQTAAASTLPLPTELAGVRVVVTDSRGAARDAALYFVAPGQVNYQLPPETADGIATTTVLRNGQLVSLGLAMAAAVAPAIFTADASGKGLPAAVVLRITADGAQTYEPIARFNTATNAWVAVPINLGAETDQVFAVLYGTGVRGRSGLQNVNCSIGGLLSQTFFAGAADAFTGVDQINVLLPRSLIGRGEVETVLTVDGKAANPVRLNIK